MTKRIILMKMNKTVMAMIVLTYRFAEEISNTVNELFKIHEDDGISLP